MLGWGGGGELSAQTRPGGLATIPDTWVLADSNTSCNTDNCALTGPMAWGDATSNGNNGADGGGNVNLRFGEINFNSAIDVNGTGNLQFTNFPANDMTIFLVFRTEETDANGDWWRAPALLSTEQGGGQSDYGIAISGGKLQWGHDGTDNALFTTVDDYNDDVPHLVTVTRDDTGPVTFSINGGVPVTGTGATGALNGAVALTLGNDLGGSADLNGYFAEVIWYPSILPNNEIELINTYLAIKHGISLGQDYAPVASVDAYRLFNHPEGIFGIGRWDISDLHQRQSVQLELGTADTAMVLYAGIHTPDFPELNTAAENPDTLINFQTLMIGHDGVAANFGTSFCGIPDKMLDRSYKAVTTQDVDSVTLVFHPDGLPALEEDGNYYMLVSPDATFDQTDTLIQLTEYNDAGGYYLYYTHYKFFNNGGGAQDSAFFTLVDGPLVSPGGAGEGLQLWVQADSAVSIGASMTWGDLSGFQRDILYPFGANVSLSTGLLNGENFVDNPIPFDRNCATAQTFNARALVVVGRAGTATNNDEYAGMTDLGFESDNNSEIKSGGGTDSWPDPGSAALWKDGTIINGTTPVADWNILTGNRPGAGDLVNGQFYLGPYKNVDDEYTFYQFAEAIAYSVDIDGGTPSAREKIETYLALKYGITLSHNYYASDGTLIYDVATYENDIAGIGVDLCGGLDKRQTMNLSENAIVEIGHVSIDANNASNPNAIPGDRQYFVYGNDGNTSDCWSNNEISANNFPTLSRLWIRIGREWRFNESAPTNIGDILLRMDTAAVPNFAFPDLPGDALGLYIFIDNDDDFSAGANAYLMTYNTTVNKFEVTIPASARPAGTGYFTFGALIDSSTVLNQSFCDGETITLIGSNLFSSGLCSEVDLNGPGGPYTISASATAPFNWTNQPDDFLNNNCLDTVFWVVPPIGTGPGEIQSGLHPLQMRINAGPCPGVNPVDYLRYESITVGSLVPSRIYWAANDSTGSDTLSTCVGDTNEPIFILQGDPGEFLLDTTVSALTDINQLMTIDTALDIYVVNVSSATAGSHAVLFTSLAAGCDTYDTLWINIDTLQQSFLSYGTLTPGNPAFREVCQGFGLYDVDSVAPPGGSISSLSSGLFMNNMGRINLLTSDTGMHAISYTPPDSLCFSPDTLLFRVVPEDSAIFQYDQMAYCLNDTNPIPLVTYLPSTVDSGFIPVGPGNTLISVDPVTGEIDLANSLAGSYRIVYHLGVTCAAYDTIDVTLYNVP
ncbi:MAG: laminin G domain-containing protein, partial [Bacteroidota bacterium]